MTLVIGEAKGLSLSCHLMTHIVDGGSNHAIGECCSGVCEMYFESCAWRTASLGASSIYCFNKCASSSPSSRQPGRSYGGWGGRWSFTEP